MNVASITAAAISQGLNRFPYSGAGRALMGVPLNVGGRYCRNSYPRICDYLTATSGTTDIPGASTFFGSGSSSKTILTGTR